MTLYQVGDEKRLMGELEGNEGALHLLKQAIDMRDSSALYHSYALTILKLVLDEKLILYKNQYMYSRALFFYNYNALLGIKFVQRLIYAIYFDYANVFDNLHPQLLLKKLKLYEFSTKLIAVSPKEPKK